MSVFAKIRSSSVVKACAALAVSASWAGSAWAEPAPAKPNVVLIVADDLGYNDLSVQGSKIIPTPNIDSIANSGVRFTDGYVTGPMCSPTRAGLLTGRYQQRRGADFNPGPRKANSGLPVEESTLADALKKGGYATGLVGKWHLGYEEQFHPQKRGFDEFTGFLGAAHPYYPTTQPANRDNHESDKPGKIIRDGKVVDEPGYLTEVFAKEATQYIEKHRNEPYFLYLAFNAVHVPMQATPKYLERFPTLSGPQQVHAAQVSALDDAVGEVLKKIRYLKQEENTLIVFISDNGGAPGNASDNSPLSGWKATVYEGGIRVPYYVQWKGKFTPAVVKDTPITQLDLYPTILAAAGVAAPADKKPDGTDITPLLVGQSIPGLADRPIFWRFQPEWAIRLGKWKLAQYSEGEAKLFDLAADIKESNDLAAANPQLVAQLRKSWDEWNANNEAPRWGDGDNVRKRARKADKNPEAAHNND